jgi:deoxyribonuclease-4
MSDFARFGPAGNSESFYASGYEKSLDVPEYLEKMGLNAFEYQSGRGVNIGKETAAELGKRAAANNIMLSLHAPYYISLSSTEEEKRKKSIDYILQAARAVDAMGGNRIIVHSGSSAKISREAALELAKETLGWAIHALDEQGLSHINICPETMGKVNQLGTLDEVLDMCLLDERLVPCIDFGHLNARDFGAIENKSDFDAILEKILSKIGSERRRSIHIHFSKIEFTPAGGEKKHLTFSDTVFGPDPMPLIELLVEKDMSPIVICESDGTQAEDAAIMKKAYERLRKEQGR